MKIGILIFLLILIQEGKFDQFNINMTYITSIFENEMLALLGMRTSKFPKEDFLNLLLYGHVDVPFTYSDFLSNFGTEVDYPYGGSVILGKDGNLGGIIKQTGDYPVIPIPGSEITEIQINLLNRLFPKGYVIRLSPTSMNFWGNGTENLSLNGYLFCSNCSILMGFTNVYKDFLFPNNVFYKSIWNNDKTFWMNTYGYVENYNDSTNKGTIKIQFYSFPVGQDFKYFYIDEKYGNEIQIDMSSGLLEYQGKFMSIYNGTPSLMNFTGTYNFSNDFIDLMKVR